jgi:hypothetical protein
VSAAIYGAGEVYPARTARYGTGAGPLSNGRYKAKEKGRDLHDLRQCRVGVQERRKLYNRMGLRAEIDRNGEILVRFRADGVLSQDERCISEPHIY